MKTGLLTVLQYLRRTDAGQRAPLRVLLRFVRLQLQRNLLKRDFHFSTCTGGRVRIAPAGDYSALTALSYLDLPDFEVNMFALHLLRPGDVFFDVGANLGPWDLLLAPRGVVCHAFEPAPATFAELESQFSLQESTVRGRLHAWNVALADGERSTRFTTDQATANRLLADGEAYAGATVTVPVSSLDSKFGYLGPTIMKIDVEGWFLPALRGAEQILSQPQLRAIVMETFRFANGSDPDLREAEALLAKHGFVPCSYDPVPRILKPLRSIHEGGQDTIYARIEPTMNALLKSGAPVAYLGRNV